MKILYNVYMARVIGVMGESGNNSGYYIQILILFYFFYLLSKIKNYNKRKINNIELIIIKNN